MQGSLQRMMNDIKSERRISSRFTELILLIDVLMLFATSFASGPFNSNSMSADELYAISGLTYALHVLLFAALIILCARLFRELHSHTQADVIMSLPMSAVQRYYSKLGFFFVYGIVPYVAAMYLSVIGTYFAEKFLYENVYTLSYIAHGVMVQMLIGLAGILFIGAVSFVCSCFATSMAEALFTSVFASGALTLLPIFFYRKLILHSAQITYLHTNSVVFNCWTLTPVYTFMSLDEHNDDGFMVAQDLPDLELALVINILISLAVMVLGVFIYKRRDKASITYNKLSKPFLFVALNLVVWAAVLYYIESTTAYFGYVAMLSAYAVFVIVLNRRGFKPLKLLKWLPGFAASLAVLVGICALCYFTDGLGIARMPAYVGDNGQYMWYTSFIVPNKEDKAFTNLCSASINNMDHNKILRANSVMDKYAADIKTFDTFLQFMGMKKGEDYMYEEEYSGGRVLMPEGYDACFIHCYNNEEPDEDGKPIKFHGITEYYILYKIGNLDETALERELKEIDPDVYVDVFDPTEPVVIEDEEYYYDYDSKEFVKAEYDDEDEEQQEDTAPQQSEDAGDDSTSDSSSSQEAEDE